MKFEDILSFDPDAETVCWVGLGRVWPNVRTEAGREIARRMKQEGGRHEGNDEGDEVEQRGEGADGGESEVSRGDQGTAEAAKDQDLEVT